MVEGQRDEAEERRGHGESLLGRSDSRDAATCGCIPVARAPRDCGEQGSDRDGAGDAVGEGGCPSLEGGRPSLEGSLQDPRAGSTGAAPCNAALRRESADSRRGDEDPLRADTANGDSRQGDAASGLDMTSYPIESQPSNARDSLAISVSEPVVGSKTVARLPRTTIAELSSSTYCYISHHAFVQDLLCTCTTCHSPTCAATGQDCPTRGCGGRDCIRRYCSGCGKSSSSSSGRGNGGSARAAEWTEVATDRLSILAHLTTFSMIGIAIQYGLDILFGPEVTHVTSDDQSIFIDLPANMLGAFLLGMMGVVFLPSLLTHSRHLAIGLTVGLCGSISTFATWNQRMVAIATAGLWVRALFGYFTGAVLPVISLVAGVDTAHNLLSLHTFLSSHPPSLLSHPLPPLLPTSTTPALPTLPPNPTSPAPSPTHPVSLTTCRYFIPMLLAAMFLWGAAVTGAVLASSSASLQSFSLACALAPPGTCLRWWLLQLNGVDLRATLRTVVGKEGGRSGGRGGGGGVGVGAGRDGDGGVREGVVAWMPWGTLVANVGASALEAAVSVIYLAVPTHTSEVMVGAVQLGFLTGLSTVSMFSLELLYLHYTLGTPWRSYLYLLLTVVSSFLIGLLVYSIPAWVMGWDSLYNHV